MSDSPKAPVVCCDLDGVLWRGDQAIAGSAHGVAVLRDAGLRVGFVSNNSSHRVGDVLAKLDGMGVSATDADVITSAHAAASMLAATLSPGAPVLACAGPGVVERLPAIGGAAGGRAHKRQVLRDQLLPRLEIPFLVVAAQELAVGGATRRAHTGSRGSGLVMGTRFSRRSRWPPSAWTTGGTGFAHRTTRPDHGSPRFRSPIPSRPITDPVAPDHRSRRAPSVIPAASVIAPERPRP